MRYTYFVSYAYNEDGQQVFSNIVFDVNGKISDARGIKDVTDTLKRTLNVESLAILNIQLLNEANI